jgi:hypothetical protein
MIGPGTRTCLAGGVLFAVSLGLPAVDTDFGDLVRGFDVRGYQSALGLVMLPLAVPLALPLSLALLAGNVWAVAAPLIILLHPSPRPVFYRARWVAPTGLVALLVVAMFSRSLGITALHVRFFAWASSLFLVALGSWRLGHR